MRPMLATPGGTSVPEGIPTGPDWVHEVKWDGVRLLADVGPSGVVLSTRSGRDVSAGFPELGGLHVVAGDALLDGEAVVMAGGRPVFSDVVDRVHVGPGGAARAAAARPLTYLVFDLLRLDGLDLTPLPWRHRRAALESVLADAPGWQVPPTYADGPGLFAATAEQGLEGIVSKRVGAPYRPGLRSPDWRKFPHRDTRSWVVGGWRPEVGTSRLGAVLVGLPAPGGLSYHGRVGSGLAGAAGAHLAGLLRPLATSGCPFVDEVPEVDRRGSTWCHPVQVVDVTSLGLTTGGRVRQGAYRGPRPDLSPEDL